MPRSLCRTISEEVSRAPDRLIYSVVIEILPIIGEIYRREALEETILQNGILTFESLDGRVSVTAKQVTAESGAQEGVAFG